MPFSALLHHGTLKIGYGFVPATVAFRSSSDLTIVGVVGDIRSDGFDTASAPYIYVSEPQAPPYVSVVYLRTGGDPGTLGEAIRHEVQAVDPGVPVYVIRTMDEVVGKNLAARRFALELLGVFAAVAFVIAAIGIYGVMAYTLAGVRVKSAFVWRSARSASTS